MNAPTEAGKSGSKQRHEQGHKQGISISRCRIEEEALAWAATRLVQSECVCESGDVVDDRSGWFQIPSFFHAVAVAVAVAEMTRREDRHSVASNCSVHISARP